MILHHYTVVDDRNVRGLLDLFAFVYGRGKDHIVALPLTLRCGGIHQWRALTVKRACLAIGVSFIVVTLQDLHFIHAHQENAAISTRLTIYGTPSRCTPLSMQLDRAE